jgi:hypothetical protein
MPRASLIACFGLFALTSFTACQASVKASANANEAKSDFSAEATSEQAPAQSATPVTATSAPVPTTASAPTPPPSDACPLTCYEARGGQAAPLTAEETTQLRSALEPVLGRMRGCGSAEEWRRYGSPILNLRIAPDGSLNELGVDPHHGEQSTCIDNAGLGATASISLPNRKVVRCSERCGHTTARGRRGR